MGPPFGGSLEFTRLIFLTTPIGLGYLEAHLKANILVVGSGASGLIKGSWDEVFCSNSAISRITQSETAAITHVASENLFLSQAQIAQRPQVLRDILLERARTIRDRKVEQIYICAPHRRIPEIERHLETQNYRAFRREFLDMRSRNKLVQKTLGYNVWVRSWIDAPAPKPNLHKFIYSLLRGRNVPHSLKPSTGVIALLLAVRKYGDAATFSLDGIGTDRSLTYYPTTHFNGDAMAHLPFDYYALTIIAARFDLRAAGSNPV